MRFGGIAALSTFGSLTLGIIIADALLNAAEDFADEFTDADTITAALASMLGERD